jgi:hypothetical protein
MFAPTLSTPEIIVALETTCAFHTRFLKLIDRSPLFSYLPSLKAQCSPPAYYKRPKYKVATRPLRSFQPIVSAPPSVVTVPRRTHNYTAVLSVSLLPTKVAGNAVQRKPGVDFSTHWLLLYGWLHLQVGQASGQGSDISVLKLYNDTCQGDSGGPVFVKGKPRKSTNYLSFPHA